MRTKLIISHLFYLVILLIWPRFKAIANYPQNYRDFRLARNGGALISRTISIHLKRTLQLRHIQRIRHFAFQFNGCQNIGLRRSAVSGARATATPIKLTAKLILHDANGI